MYDRAIYSHIATLSGHEKPVNSLAMNPNLPEQMVSVSSDGHWIIWDLNTSKELRRGAGDGHGLACVAWEVGRSCSTLTMLNACRATTSSLGATTAWSAYTTPTRPP